ncbi:MAG: GFA family protein [Burkholderiales bacterium]
MLEGSCLCGRIRYEVDGELGPIGNCHCRTCRKAHSAAFATTARVPRERFRWTRGESEVAGFESTPGKTRFFCSRCGSHLIAAWDGAPNVIVRVGSLDADPGARPRLHIWTSQKAPWHAISDALPQFEEAPRAK